MFSKETATTSSGGENCGFWSFFLLCVTYISSIQGNATLVRGENSVFTHSEENLGTITKNAKKKAFEGLGLCLLSLLELTSEFSATTSFASSAL